MNFSVKSISFVVPAHNEELFLRDCLESIRQAANTVLPEKSIEYEIIVSNDASTDQTRTIAEELADRTVDVELRNIGAVRNAGARVAKNELLIFVDADTQFTAETLQAIIHTVKKGTIGGGAWFRFDQRLDPIRFLMAYTFLIIWLDIVWSAAGCLVFVLREEFEAIGGFNEQYFAAEELYLSRAIQRRGRFKIVRAKVVTSARKMRSYTFWGLLKVTIPPLIRGPMGWKSRDHLEILYDAKRD